MATTDPVPNGPSCGLLPLDVRSAITDRTIVRFVLVILNALVAFLLV